MKMNKFLLILILAGFGSAIQGQNLHYFFIDDIYQRSYFNPALDNQNKIRIASGLGFDFSTNGPSISDITVKNPDGGLIVSASNAIPAMNEINDLFGHTSVNTIDVSINTSFLRISAGHAWKAQAWMEYTKDLGEFVTNGNAAFVGETLNLGPQLDYINYNEVYLGLQKSFGGLSIGARIKRLSGVESIRTENSQVDLTTSDDIYQLTLTSDYELRSSRAFNYEDIRNFSLDVENFSFDNFMSNNGGWAFDFGASLDVGDKLELSLGVVDVGSINWDVDPKIFRSNEVQHFDGIDVSQYITSDEEFVILDSLEALLDLEESQEEFSTTLPAKIYLGGRLKISDSWSVGALIQSNGSGDRRANVIALNGTIKLNKFLSAGVLYSIKNGDPANIGLHTAFNLGPVVAFLSSDNVINFGSFNSTNGNIRLGVSVQI